MAKVPPFSELIAATTRSAVHLETRDAYTPDDPRFVRWLAGEPVPVPGNPDWSDLVRAHTARGVRFRRARIVSEPLADYIRFEYALTSEVNVSAGEAVRWLPRRQRAHRRVREETQCRPAQPGRLASLASCGRRRGRCGPGPGAGGADRGGDVGHVVVLQLQVRGRQPAVDLTGTAGPHDRAGHPGEG